MWSVFPEGTITSKGVDNMLLNSVGRYKNFLMNLHTANQWLWDNFVSENIKWKKMALSSKTKAVLLGAAE
jgi:hypothetical protein